MGGAEQLPQDNPYTREVFELLGLQLHVHEMHGMAQHRDTSMLRDLGPTDRATNRRLIIVGYPKSSRPPEQQVVPVRHERIVLLPNPTTDEDIKRVIVRLPLTDIADRSRSDRVLRNAFIEVVRENGRDLLLLNSAGLWRYDSAADIYSADGDDFQVPGAIAPEPPAVVHQIDRYITGFSYDQQTNIDSFD